MRGLFLIAFLGGLAACSQPVPPSPAPSDEDLRALLVGAWHPGSDSTEFGQPVEEVFSADGTYVAYTYRDATCRTVQSAGDFKWSIKGAILYTSAADSTDEPAKDEILRLDQERLKTRSMESQEIYSRRRGYLCETRAPRPTPTAPHETSAKPSEPPVNGKKPGAHFGEGDDD